MTESSRISRSQKEPLYMDAYYYSFEPTGVRAIDLILSAVASAGKQFHHTSQWQEQSSAYEEEFRGETPVERIQNAAIDAAKLFQSEIEPTALEQATQRAEVAEEACRLLRHDLERALTNHAADLTPSHEQQREPDGYAVLLDDPKGETPGGCGYWYVGAYRTEAAAKCVAERGKQGARVVPMFFAPSAIAPSKEAVDAAERYLEAGFLSIEKSEMLCNEVLRLAKLTPPDSRNDRA